MVSTTRRPHRAFTLAELAVTMAVVAILAAISIAGLNAVNDRQQRSVARIDVNAVLQSQQRFLAVYDTFTDFPADLSGVSSDITVTAGPSIQPRQVSIALSNLGGLGLASKGTDGLCAFQFAPPPGSASEQETWFGEQGDLCDARSAIPEGDFAIEPDSSRTSWVLSQL
jgi:prepilin-type N-terminal cleavage/methylation domain-containing protein